MYATSITLDDAMETTYSYTVNQGLLSIAAPTYTNSPDCEGMSVDYTYEVWTDPAQPETPFVTVNGANIEVETTNGKITGVYTVYVKATETFS